MTEHPTTREHLESQVAPPTRELAVTQAQFVECEALPAIMNGDREEAERLLADSHDTELNKLADHATFLADVCDVLLASRAYTRRQAAERVAARQSRVAS